MKQKRENGLKFGLKWGEIGLSGVKMRQKRCKIAMEIGEEWRENGGRNGVEMGMDHSKFSRENWAKTQLE